MRPRDLSDDESRRPENCDGHYFEALPGGGDVIQARCTACGMRAAFTPQQWEELKDA